MKSHRHPGILATALLLALFNTVGSAITLYPTDDTYSTLTYTGKPPVVTKTAIASITGTTAYLTVNSLHTSFVQFKAGAALAGAPVSKAVLNLWFYSVTKPGMLDVDLVTASWKEQFTGLPVSEPNFNAASPVAIIPASSVVAKQFVSVDVTAAVQAWVANPTMDFGLAISTPDNVANVNIGAKEGTATGYPATLQVTLSGAGAPALGTTGTFTGTVTASSFSGSGAGLTGIPATSLVPFSITGNQLDQDLALSGLTTGNSLSLDGTLSASTAFLVEPRPKNNPATVNSNLFIGANAGAANTSGQANLFMGPSAGLSNVQGSSNIFLGYQAGLKSVSTSDNVYIGVFAGSYATGTYNNFVGYGAGYNDTTGSNNNYFGTNSGQASGASNNNAFFGHQAGQNNTASNNSFFGSGAGTTNVVGTQDCYFGINAGNKTNASFNSFFGAGAGQFVTSGAGNTFMGNIAGVTITTGSSNTFIGGSSGAGFTVESHNTLLGDQANGAAGAGNASAIGANAYVGASNSLVLGSINGVNGATADTNVGIGTTTPNSTLQVDGSVSYAIRSASAAVLIGLNSSDHVLIVTGAGASNVGLPSPSGIAGRVYIIKNRSTGTITLGPLTGNATIDGNASATVAANTGVIQVITDGTSWYKIN